MEIPYIVGQEYNRREDLHGRFGGGWQSGMSPCKDHPVMFIFTGSGGEQHGYVDRFDDDNGRFYYSGEGQKGDMVFTKGNKALKDHVANGRHVLLFEQTRKGHCKYRGEYTYLGHHYETQPDTNGNARQAIIFELALETLEAFNPDNSHDEPTKLIPKTTPLKELRKLAKTGSGGNIHSRSTQTRIYYRSQAVKRYALARASGVCEACDSAAPFLTRKHEPYLEVHHIYRVADGGPDDPEGVAAICPTCHRRVHNGIDGKDYNNNLAEIILGKEQD